MNTSKFVCYISQAKQIATFVLLLAKLTKDNSYFLKRYNLSQPTCPSPTLPFYISTFFLLLANIFFLFSLPFFSSSSTPSLLFFHFVLFHLLFFISLSSLSSFAAFVSFVPLWIAFDFSWHMCVFWLDCDSTVFIFLYLFYIYVFWYFAVKTLDMLYCI